MRNHCGMHPLIMKQVVNHPAWNGEMHKLSNWIDPGNERTHGEGKELLVISVCVAGRHRSDAIDNA